MLRSSRAAFYSVLVLSVCALLTLCWGFIPLSVPVKTSLTVVILLVAAVLVSWRSSGRSRTAVSTTLEALPDSRFCQPVVLVCGDGLDALFAEAKIRLTLAGCYIKTDPTQPLSVFTDALLSQRSGWVRQLALLYSFTPDKHQDLAVFRAAIRQWRQQVDGLQKRLGYRFPLLISCCFNGLPSPWFVFESGGNGVVAEEDNGTLRMDEWLKAAGIETQAKRAAVIPGLNAALSWLQNLLREEMQGHDLFAGSLHPLAVGIRFLPQRAVDNSLWAEALARRTSLKGVALPAAEQTLPFPDIMLPLLPAAREKRRAVGTPLVLLLIITAFSLSALASVIANNQRLIGVIGVDLQRYLMTPMTNDGAKARALVVLKQDALLLERWHRQGEPLHLGLGLYGGERLWLALQAEIDRYIPPSLQRLPDIVETPQTLRLDSLALFDVGKPLLRPGSTKILVDALLNIKVRPDWLIVVSGHTDSSGDKKVNQQLSLKRAEAVRDWMLATSDIPPACFAVQGFGASRPIASNDSSAGRAANRRVEISLVPQTNACQADGSLQASSAKDDALPQKER